MIPCPPPQRNIAISQGLPDDDVDALWARHVDLVQKGEPPREYGGFRWKKLVEKAVESPRLPTVKADDPVVLSARRREAAAKRAEDEEYMRGAVSLGEWLRALQAGATSPSVLETRLLGFREPKARETDVEWLFAALAEGEPTPRLHPCAGCGLRQAASVVIEGRCCHRAQCDSCARVDRTPQGPHAPQIGMPRNVRDPARPRLVQDWHDGEDLLP